MSFEYPRETGFGGIGTYTWYQARGLAKLGHEVHVLAGATSPTQLRSEEHDGVKVYRFRADGPLMRCFQIFNKFGLSWTRNRLENALSMYCGLEVLRDDHHYDLVEMPECGAEGLLVNYLMPETTLTKFHGPARLVMRYYDVFRADISLCSFIEHLGMRRSRAYSACSKFLAGEARDKLGIRAPIQVIPNGIDLELFDAAEQLNFHRKFDIPRDRLTIFFSGRMEQRKGIHLCVEIAASILERYEAAFVFAGQDLFNYMSDCLLPNLKTRKLKGSVHYLGKLDLADVRSCLRQTDIFLIPSLWENCPYSCLEAMAAGRAVVSSDAGGMPELIHDGENGLVARSGDTGAFISCLERVIEDHSLRDRLGRAARLKIEQSYTDVHIAKVSVNYYEKCIQRRAL
jgi:glycosyltransferase involved in cell wall biosynthesis